MEIKKPKNRTKLQNRALHLYFTLLSDELNDAGLDMKIVLDPKIDIPWSPRNIKELLWRPLQKAAIRKASTTELTTQELQAVFQILDRYLSEKFGISVPFPSEEQTSEYLKSLINSQYE